MKNQDFLKTIEIFDVFKLLGIFCKSKPLILPLVLLAFSTTKQIAYILVLSLTAGFKSVSKLTLPSVTLIFSTGDHIL